MKKKAVIILMLALAIVLMPTKVNRAFASKEVYQNYVSAKVVNNSGLYIQPTGIYEPENHSDLSYNAISTAGISSIVLTPDRVMNVVFKDQTKPFKEVFNNSIKGKFIPVLRLDAGTVDGFIDMMNNTYYIKDIMVITADVEVLKKIYEDQVASIANLVYDLTDVEISSDRYGSWKYLAEANKYYANTLMFDGSDKNLGVVAEYVSAMSKVCWALVDGKSETVNAVSVGCTGILTKNYNNFKDAVATFSKKGWAKAQNVAAHRGITAYANENSLTAVSAAASEGATHVEIDIQYTNDGRILLCHDMVTDNVSSTKKVSFEPARSSYIRTLKLNDYSEKYQDTFPTLEEVIDATRNTDIILIIELKLEDGRTSIIKKGAIEKFLSIMKSYPEMDGRWFCITFYRPYADKMRELAPEIPVGFLGGATSGFERDNNIKGWDGEWTPMTNISSKIAFMHKFKTLLDESHADSPDSTVQNYLARGYVENGWTFKDLSHFNTKKNIATSDAVEKCAMAIKKIEPTNLTITADDLNKGKISVNTVNYCGWKEQRECDIIVVSQNEREAELLLYYNETVGGVSYGLYSQLMTYEII